MIVVLESVFDILNRGSFGLVQVPQDAGLKNGDAAVLAGHNVIVQDVGPRVIEDFGYVRTDVVTVRIVEEAARGVLSDLVGKSVSLDPTR